MSRSGVAPLRPPRGWWVTVLVLPAVCAVWILLSQVPVWPWSRTPVFLGADGLLTALENPTIDARFAWRGDLPSPLKVVYVDVDTDALNTLGNFPWNRAIFAALLDALFDHGRVRGVGLDFVFSATGIPNLGRAEAEEGSLALGRSVQRNGDAVVLAASYGSEQSPLGKRGTFPFLFDSRTNPYDADLPELPAFPVAGPTWGRIGLIDVVHDEMRHVPLFAETQMQTYLALSLQLALIHYGLGPRDVELGPREIVLRAPGGGEAARIPLWLRQLVEPNWFSPWFSELNPRASVVTVLESARLAADGDEGEKARAAEFFAAFHDALVLVGPTDPLLKDIAVAPLNGGRPVPRVSLHGNLLKTIVGGRYLWRPPVWVNVLLILGVGLGLAASAVLPRAGKLLAVAGAVLYAAAAFVLFAVSDLILPLVAPLGAALSCTLAALFMKLSREDARRRRIRQLFGAYVSPAVVAEIVDGEVNPQTGGEEVEITAFFSDVVAFSRIAGQLPPRELVALMSEYFAEGTTAITGAGGTLDKYVGDAIIAIFGAPLPQGDHAAAACRAALGLQEAQARLRRRWAAAERVWPAEVLGMRTRIGLNTGPAVVGNVGSELRFNYTMMGETVNLAQRLEAAVAHFGVDIMVSAATRRAAARDDDQLVFRELDQLAFAGQSGTSEVWELVGRGPQARRDNEGRLSAYAAALELYRRGCWAEAGAAFAAAAALEPAAGRLNPCTVMAARCDTLRAGGAPDGGAFAIGKS